jgi:molybdopterin synthase sulfur carrier subunit
MTVDVALFAYLSDYQPDGQGGRSPRQFDLELGTRISDVIADLGLPDDPRVVFVNGRHALEDTVLSDGDRLAIFPPVAGG